MRCRIRRDDSCKMNYHLRCTLTDTVSCRTTTDIQYTPTKHSHTHKTLKIMITLEWATTTRKKMGSGHLKTSSPSPFQSNCLFSFFNLAFFSQQKSSAFLSFPSASTLFYFSRPICPRLHTCRCLLVLLHLKAALEPTAIKLMWHLFPSFFPLLLSHPCLRLFAKMLWFFSPPVFTSDNVRGVAVGIKVVSPWSNSDESLCKEWKFSNVNLIKTPKQHP